MLRAVSFIVSIPAMVVGLFAANCGGALSLVGTLLGILAIISFAVIAIGWTQDHDVAN